MPRIVEIAEGVVQELMATQTTIRRFPAGGGSVAFTGLYLIRHDGAIIGTRNGETVSAGFEYLGGILFAVPMPDGSVAQVPGETILAALDAVFDYIRDSGITAPEPPVIDPDA